jgi:hypothetical protein
VVPVLTDLIPPPYSLDISEERAAETLWNPSNVLSPNHLDVAPLQPTGVGSDGELRCDDFGVYGRAPEAGSRLTVGERVFVRDVRMPATRD